MKEKRTLGIDLACTAEHRATLADERGEYVWSGYRFTTRLDELDALWADVAGQGSDDDVEVTVVMEPTRNAWAPLASWFEAKGAIVVMIPFVSIFRTRWLELSARYRFPA